MSDHTVVELLRDRAAHQDVIARLQAARRRLVPLVAEVRAWHTAAQAAMVATMRADRTGRSWGPAALSLDVAQAAGSDYVPLLIRVDVRIAEHRRAVQAIDGQLAEPAPGPTLPAAIEPAILPNGGGA